MRCKWCDDIIDMGPPTKKQLKIEDECPWKKTKKPYEASEFVWGKKHAKAYKKMREEYDKVLL